MSQNSRKKKRNCRQNFYCNFKFKFRKNLMLFPEDNEKEVTVNLKDIKKILSDKKNVEFNLVNIN